MRAEIGKRYRHFKHGDEYTVLHIARLEATEEECVVYRAEYTTKYGQGTIWVRPRISFEEKVVVDGVSIPRFLCID